MSHFEGTKILFAEDPNPGILSSAMYPILPAFKSSLEGYLEALAIPFDQVFNPIAHDRFMNWPTKVLSTLNVNYMYSDGINGMLGPMMQNTLRYNVGEDEPTRIKDIVPELPGGTFLVSKKPNVLLSGPNSGECGRRLIGNGGYQYQYNMTGTNYYYAGIEAFDPGEDVDLCRVYHKIGTQGDFSGKTLYCQVWSKSGNDLDTMLAESEPIVGNSEMNNWTSSPFLVPFFFSPAYTLLNGTTYAIVVTMKEADAANYWKSYRGPDSAQPLGNIAAWNSSGVRQTSNSYEPSFILYVKA